MDLNKIYFDLEGKECNILQLVKSSPEWAANRIQEGEKAIAILQESTGSTKNKGLKICITEIIFRIVTWRGAIAKSDKVLINEFGKHFKQTRKAWSKGDLETVAEFFGLYTD